MEFNLKKLSKLCNVGILCEEDGVLISYNENPNENPLFSNKELRQNLEKCAKNQKVPFIYKDDFKVYYVCILKKNTAFYAGPFSMHTLSKIELHRYYKYYGIVAEQEKPLRVFSFSEFMDFIQLLENLLNGIELDDKALVSGNEFIKESREQEERMHILFQMKLEEEMIYHHSYREELLLLDCVREGRTSDALEHTRKIDGDIGKMSDREINHWRNAAIVGITLCTRAAIDGGVAPSIAYQLSDFYIKKCDNCDAVDSIIKNRNLALEKLSEEVAQIMKKKHLTSYVEQCKDYVRKHYSEKIYVDDIASNLGVSSNYLSRLFNRETGIRLQDYIISVRVEKAANMLKYSSESISTIAEYVNFPSQSYMGKVFKELKGVTPRKYRENNKPREFR